MRSCRSSLFAAIISLFVLTGYACGVFDYCCAPEMQRQAAFDGSDAPVQGDDCQCLCHQIFSPYAVGPLRVTPAVLIQADRVALVDEIPPDAVPRGIDYPPQLA